jgi:hypothetical protein
MSVVRLCIALVLALAGALVGAAPADANQGDVVFTSGNNSGLCLDAAFPAGNGAAVTQRNCYPTTPLGIVMSDLQRWYYERTGCSRDVFGRTTCWYLVRNRYSGKCLDVAGISKDDGAAVQLWDCWSGPNQQWAIEDAGFFFDGEYFTVQLVSRHSGRCLDVWGSSTESGGNVVQRGCTGEWNQLWSDNLSQY